MATPKELDQWYTAQLYKLMMIKLANCGHANKRLDDAIGETKASMTKESIAWVEQQIKDHA